MNNVDKKHAIIIGAGPSGLTAGIELLKTKKFSVHVLERDAMLGGLARTYEYKGCRYDIGPHHFITSSDWVTQWWDELMSEDFHPHNRFTRIYYNNHFFNYPLDPVNVIRGLSLFECARCVLSYVKSRIFPIKNVKTFQDWVSNKFGYRLFSIFFETYTEKVWGIACDEISSDWAAQRIKGFSLSQAIFYAFFGKWFKKNAPRTLVDKFHYPSKGSGTLWERAAKRLEAYEGGTVTLNQEVISIEHEGKRITGVYVRDTNIIDPSAQKIECIKGDYYLSSMPLQALVLALDKPAPESVIVGARGLQYRGLITVNLIINKTAICPDHWLYIHEKKVKMGRIGNMNNFSLKMVDNPEHTALSLEYFSFVNDEFWKQSDVELLKLGAQELEQIGLIKESDVIDGMIVRTPEAYPLYDANYQQHLKVVLNYLSGFENLQLMGRNGMHRYNNMDIAMLSAKSAVDKILGQENFVHPKMNMSSSTN